MGKLSTPSLVVLCMVTIGATGCSDELRRQILPQQSIPGSLPQTWTRVDGQPIDAAQLDVDKTVCRGAMDEANNAAGNNARLHPEVFGYSEGMISVYSSCMAQNGYTATK
jgi:hypothetical protein